MKKTIFGRIAVAVAIASMAVLSACGGGGGTPSDEPLSVNSLDGATGVAVNSAFRYSFADVVDQSSVTTGSYFIVPAAVAAAQVVKEDVDPATCDPANALAASVTCGSLTACDLTPAADLEEGAGYAICLTDDILFANGTAFAGFMASFTTAAGGGYTVGGTVAGLDAGESVVLQNNAADDLAVSADGAFTFATALADGADYAVTVRTPPAGKSCAVANDAGTIAGADVTDVSVVCGYTVGGKIAGLGSGKSVVLQNNAANDFTVSTDGAFTFAKIFADGTAYAVTVLTQPDGQTCEVTSGTGTIAAANVTDVSVACEPDIMAGYRSRWTLSNTLLDSGTAGNDLEGDDGGITYSETVKKAGPSSGAFTAEGYVHATNFPHQMGSAPVAYSIALWVYPATGIGNYVYAFYNATGFRMVYDSGDLIVGYNDPGDHFAEAIDLDTWTHVVFTYKQDGTVSNLYLNGVNVGAPLIQDFDNSLTSTQWLGQDWIGFIDDVVLYDVELSAGQVTALYGAY